MRTLINIRLIKYKNVLSFVCVFIVVVVSFLIGLSVQAQNNTINVFNNFQPVDVVELDDTSSFIQSRNTKKFTRNFPVSFPYFVKESVVVGERSSEGFLEIIIPEGTSIRDENNELFTDTFHVPVLEKTREFLGYITYATISVGNPHTSLFFVHGDKPKNITVRIPVSDKNFTTQDIIIWSSQDGKVWEKENQKGYFIREKGSTYIEFVTNHCTFFTLGSQIGSFVINNDDPTTYSTNVTLEQTITGATQMRFADSAAGLANVAYQTFSTTFSYDLSGSDGMKTVFAEFMDGGGTTVVVSDTIELQRLARAGRVENIPDNQRVTVFFDKTYTSIPVVIATPTTDANGNNYPIPRIRNITTTSFELSVCLDDGGVTCATAIAPENIDFVVFDRDIASTLSRIDVGTIAASTDGSTTATSFTSSISGLPQVWTTAQTSQQGSSVAATSRVRDISVNGFGLIGCTHPGQANTCSTSSAAEIFGYVAIHFLQSDIEFFAGISSMGASTWTNFLFPISRLNPIMIATQNSDNGVQDPQYPWIRNVTTNGGQVRYCEADGANVCDSHATEDVAWGVFDRVDLPYVGITYSPSITTTGSVVASIGLTHTGITIINNGGSPSYTFTNNGSFTFNFVDANGFAGSVTATVDWIVTPGSLNELVIADLATNVSPTTWTTITLPKTYANIPVVLTQPVTDNNGNNYPIAMVRNVTTNSFELKLCVDDGATTCSTTAVPEDVHYFVFDKDIAQGYPRIDVGTVAVATDGSDSSLAFSQSFSANPSIWTTSQTANQGNTIAAIAWADDISFSSANLVGCVHQGIGDFCTSGQPTETMGYVAIDTTAQSIPTLQAGQASMDNSNWTTVNFSPAYITPLVMTTQNSDNGGQDPQYPGVRNVSSTSAQVRYCEADGANTCDSHATEIMAWFAVERYTDPVIFLQAPTDCSIVGYSTQNYSYDITHQCSGYFSVYDTTGLDDGYYTTVQVTDLVGNYSTISDSSIALLSGPLQTLSGSTNPSVYIPTSMNSFQIANNPLTYIQRDSGPNSLLQGQYGSLLSLRIPIQAYTSPDVFTGMIVFTLFD